MAEETPHARADRELIELLNELRVALPGVQVLFAFLLAVPFQQRFHQATGFQRHAYFVTLTAALISDRAADSPVGLSPAQLPPAQQSADRQVREPLRDRWDRSTRGCDGMRNGAHQ